jgi:hypothetical protein
VFVERLDKLPPELPDFRPAPPISDREAWTNLPADIAERLLTDGAEALAKPWPALLASDYMRYLREGDRARFEALYFARRNELNALVLAECVADDGRFLDAVIDGIWLLCEESGWQLPAHNSQVRDGTRFPLPDPAKPVIDLFAAETGAQLAMVASLLGERLDAVSPDIVARIDSELETRLFGPYLARHFWWMGNGDEKMNNWTAWCTQNVLLAAFARPLPAEKRDAILRRAAASLDAFAKDYGEDGACEEGPLYYRHAALCLWGALTVLSNVAPDAFAPLWRLPKIRNMAEYLPFMHVAGAHYINFADSSAVLEPAGAREFLFGVAVGSPALTSYALTDTAGSAGTGQPGDVNLWYRTIEIMAAHTMRTQAIEPVRRPDRYFASIGLLVARDGEWTLGVKAGDNGDGHNHNDVGSVTLYRGETPFLIDIGVETYTAKTFSPQRYEIWTMQSAWHNLPTFGGVMQRDGAEYGASDVAVEIGDDVTAMRFDIAGAYPPQARLRSYRRSVELVKGRGVRIEDLHDGDLPAELSLIFAHRPVLHDWGIALDGLGRIAVSGAGAPRVEEVAITDARLRLAWPQAIWRVLLPFDGAKLSLWITGEVS